MTKKVILTFIFLLIFAIPDTAKIYDIPPDLEQEVKEKRKIFISFPESNEARFELAMCYGYTGQIEKGWTMLKEIPVEYAPIVVEKYTALSKKEPKQWKHNFKLAFGYYFIKNVDEAHKEFLKVLDIDPKHIWAMGFLALLDLEEKKLDESLRWCKKALAIEPNATAVHFLLAETYRQKGKYFESFAELMIVGRLKTEEKMAGRYDDED
ncbi:tetratricopeptide repeat protein [Thermoproteota archaeon]